MQLALYLLPFPMLMMQHFVVRPNWGLSLSSCLLRPFTAATLVACSAASAAFGNPQTVLNPPHSWQVNGRRGKRMMMRDVSLSTNGFLVQVSRTAGWCWLASGLDGSTPGALASFSPVSG